MSLTNEEHAWLRKIEEKIDIIQRDIAKITAYGCAQAPRHDDHEKRIRAVEAAEAKREGRVAIIAAIFSSVCSAAVMSLGSLFRK